MEIRDLLVNSDNSTSIYSQAYINSYHDIYEVFRGIFTGYNRFFSDSNSEVDNESFCPTTFQLEDLMLVLPNVFENYYKMLNQNVSNVSNVFLKSLIRDFFIDLRKNADNEIENGRLSNEDKDELRDNLKQIGGLNDLHFEHVSDYIKLFINNPELRNQNKEYEDLYICLIKAAVKAMPESKVEDRRYTFLRFGLFPVEIAMLDREISDTDTKKVFLEECKEIIGQLIKPTEAEKKILDHEGLDPLEAYDILISDYLKNPNSFWVGVPKLEDGELL